MTGQRDIDRVLDQWFEDGPSEIADRVLDDALLTIDHTTQRRGVLRLPRRRTMTSSMRLVAIWVAVLAIVAIGAGLFQRGGMTNVGGAASASPSLTTPSPASASPSAASGGLAALSSVVVFEHFGGRLDGAPAKPGENAINRLWVFDPSGPRSEAHELLPARPGSQGGPAWSADGTRLAFTDLGDVEQIYLTNATGRDPTLLETSCPPVSTSRVRSASGVCDDSEPSFSPDGAKIVFRRVVFGGGRSEPPTSNVLAIVDIASGQVVDLSTTQVTLANDVVWNEYPRWSPDGKRILFYRTTWGPDGKATGSSIYLVDVDGRNLVQVPTVPFVGDAEWSPDGSTIAFGTYPWHPELVPHGEPAANDVYTIHPDGTGLVRLTTDGMSSSPSWTSDGRIAFIRAFLVGGISAPDVWLMAADGRDQTQLSLFIYGPGQCCSFYAQVQPSP